MIKRFLAGLMAGIMAVSLVACASSEKEVPADSAPVPQTAAPEETAAKSPKYVFLFIGDGMSYPQF